MNELAVVVMSCDKYRDAWHPFYHFFKKYWGDCPYPIYHVSESVAPNVSVKNNFMATDQKKWSGMLLDVLGKISEKYILLLLEDYFLIKNVKNNEIENCLEILKKEKASFIRIFPCPEPNTSLSNYADIGLIDVQAKNALNTQATIWEREMLTQLLLSEETIGEFEQNINSRAEKTQKKFFCVKIKGDPYHLENGDYPYTYLCTAIVQGKWTREAVKLCKKENILLDFKYRKMQTRIESYFYSNYEQLSPLLRTLLYFCIPKKII